MATAVTTPNGVDTTPTVYIPRLDATRIELHIVGQSSLICHAWSEKAKEMMRDKQMKRATTGREAKDPHADFLGSLYPLPEWQREESGCEYGFPSTAFKSAMVGAARYLDMKMTVLRGALHVDGELVPIIGTPVMREDMVRLNGLTADIRYRGEFMPWEARIPITYNTSTLSYEQVANLLQQAGFSIGIGEWRPEKNGQHGRWSLASG